MAFFGYGSAANLQEVRAALADIIADARRTDEVIRRLQAFVTTGALEQTLLDVNDVVREVIQLVHKDVTRQQMTITLDLAATLPAVRGDHIQLRQVVLNLVRNAFEAMQQGDAEARTLVVCTSSETPEVITVAVQDNGIGVDEMSMAHLFHPFFTTKAGGMGLGLALTAPLLRRTAAENMGCTESRAGTDGIVHLAVSLTSQGVGRS